MSDFEFSESDLRRIRLAADVEAASLEMVKAISALQADDLAENLETNICNIVNGPALIKLGFKLVKA